MKFILSFALFFLSFNAVYSQSDPFCTLKGTVSFKSNLEPIPFARIQMYQNNLLTSGAITDFDGKYIITGITPGEYRIKISSPETEEKIIENFLIKKDSNDFKTCDILFEKKINDIEEVQIVAHKIDAKRIERIPAMQSNARSVSILKSNKARGARVKTNEPSRETYNRIVENEFKTALKNPLSTFSIDVDKASYSNIRRYLKDNKKPPIDAVRIEEMINYFHYDYPSPQNEEPFSIHTGYSDCPWNKEHTLAFIGLQGKQIEMTQAVPNNLVFLIDVSGSMNSHDKLVLLKSGLYLLIDQLRQEDQVSIVVYAGAAGVVLPVTSGNMKDEIKNAIEQLSAGGSTAGGQGIELAYKMAKENFLENGNNRIILASDGDFNVGISNQSELIKLIESKREENIYLSVLGFGTGNIQDGTMEQLADKGNGNYNYIDNINEAKKVLVDEMGGTLLTIANDVKLQVEFNPKNVKGYRLIGYENRSLNDEDFNNDKVDAGDMGAGHSVTAIYEVIPHNSKDTLSSIDELKYQKKYKTQRGKSLSEELLTVKIRYKNPKEIRSILTQQIIENNPVDYTNLPEYFRFAGTVAAFGKLLRDSKFSGEIDLTKIKEMAENSIGEDKGEYRKEFIHLIERSETLAL